MCQHVHVGWEFCLTAGLLPQAFPCGVNILYVLTEINNISTNILIGWVTCQHIHGGLGFCLTRDLLPQAFLYG